MSLICTVRALFAGVIHRVFRAAWGVVAPLQERFGCFPALLVATRAAAPVAPHACLTAIPLSVARCCLFEGIETRFRNALQDLRRRSLPAPELQVANAPQADRRGPRTPETRVAPRGGNCCVRATLTFSTRC